MEELLFKKHKKKKFAVFASYIAIIISGVFFGIYASRFILDPLLEGYTIGFARFTRYVFMVSLYSLLLAIYAAIKTRQFVKNLINFENSNTEILVVNKRVDKTFCVKCGIILTREHFLPSKKKIKSHYFNGFIGYFCKKCYKKNAISISILFAPLIAFLLWFLLGEIDIFIILINSLILIAIFLDMVIWYRYYKLYT